MFIHGVIIPWPKHGYQMVFETVNLIFINNKTVK